VTFFLPAIARRERKSLKYHHSNCVMFPFTVAAFMRMTP
jgi:hypothetical protein